MEDHEPGVMGQHSGALCLHATVSRALRTPAAPSPRRPHQPGSGPRASCGHGSTGAPRHRGEVGMNWRDTLGVARPPGSSYTHNSQNTQNSVELGNCADIADSAYGDREMDERRLHNGSHRSSIRAQRKRDADALRRLILTPHASLMRVAPWLSIVRDTLRWAMIMRVGTPFGRAGKSCCHSVGLTVTPCNDHLPPTAASFVVDTV